MIIEHIEEIKKICENNPKTYSIVLSSKKYISLYNEIMEETKNLPLLSTLGKRINYILNGFSEFPKCKICGNPIIARNNLKWNEKWPHYCSSKCMNVDSKTIVQKIKNTKLLKYGNENYNGDISKIKLKNVEKYGKEWFFQTDEFKNKTKNSKELKYGCSHHMKSEEFIQKYHDNYEKIHGKGIKTSFCDKDVQKKIKESNLSKYGVEYPFQNNDIHKKAHEKSVISQKLKFYNTVINNNDKVIPLFNEYEYTYNMDKHKIFRWKCKKCGREFNSIIPWCNNTNIPRCYDCYPPLVGTSKFEIEVFDFLKSLNCKKYNIINGERDNNTILNNRKQLDILIKDGNKIKYGIECDGLYWHSEEFGCYSNYHVSKTEECEKIGFQLIHIFEDEWRYKRDIIESRIKNILGIYDKVIYARKCKVKVVDNKESEEFISKNHIQGACRAKINLGLYHENELVSLMTFGKPRMTRKYDWELIRFCNTLNYHVIGGASKLLSYFEKNYVPKSLLSYADRRWSIGKLYEKLGFTLSHKSKPNYWYIDKNRNHRLYRFNFRKSKLKNILMNFDDGISEINNMKNNGYEIIWDCGNLVYVKEYHHDI